MSIVKQLILCAVLLAIAGVGYGAWQIFGPKVVATATGGAGGGAPANNATQANNATNAAGAQRGPATGGGAPTGAAPQQAAAGATQGGAPAGGGNVQRGQGGAAGGQQAAVGGEPAANAGGAGANPNPGPAGGPGQRGQGRPAGGQQQAAAGDNAEAAAAGGGARRGPPGQGGVPAAGDQAVAGAAAAGPGGQGAANTGAGAAAGQGAVGGAGFQRGQGGAAGGQGAPQQAAAGANPAGNGGPRAGAVGGAGGARAAIAVTTSPVNFETIGDQLKAVGTAAAARAITVFALVSGGANGVVTEVPFREGSKVKAGDVLLKLDDADQKIALDKARIALADAQSAFDRSSQLAKTQNLTNVALDTAKSTLDKAQNDLQTAQVALSRRTVTAPFAGMVGLSTHSVGDLLTAQTAVTTLDDLSSLTVTFDAPQRFVELVAVGTAVIATAEGLPGQSIKGKVTAVDSRLDPITRTFKVEATLQDGIADVKPGMAIAVTCDFPGKPQATVPSLAVQWDRTGSYVWRLDGNVAHRIGVDIQGRRAGSVVVTGDLKQNDELVVEGLQRVREGATVTKTPAVTAAGPQQNG